MDRIRSFAELFAHIVTCVQGERKHIHSVHIDYDAMWGRIVHL